MEDQHEEEITSRKYYDPREITCPLCKKKCSVPAGGVRNLSDNHLVLNLSEVVTKRKEELRKEEEEPSCEVCKNDFDFDECEELKKDIEKCDNFGKRNSVPGKMPTEQSKKNKKRRKSFMSAGLVLRSSAYDESSKTAESLMEEEEENEATEEVKSENNCSSSGVSSTSTSSRNTQSIGEKRANSNNTDNITKSNSKNDRRATSKCLECNKLLCGSCVERHHGMKVTSGHCLIDIETQRDVLCKEHPGEAVRFSCFGAVFNVF